MAKKKDDKKIKTLENPWLKRYPPNCHYESDIAYVRKYFKHRKVDYGKSLTDKESYRLSLVAQASGRLTNIGSGGTPQYMYDDGKYNAKKDISYLLRNDLSIVQIDDYIHKLEESFNESKGEIKESIKNELEKAKKMADARKAELKARESEGGEE